MSKLPEKYRFLDLSDYGRPIGHWIASQLKSTIFTPIHVTTMFIIAGVIAIALMINGFYITASFFIILYHILLYHIASYCIRLYHIASYCITSYIIISFICSEIQAVGDLGYFLSLILRCF